MSSSTAGSPADLTAPPRRVRHQAREAMILMAFSAVMSVGLASALLLISQLSARG